MAKFLDGTGLGRVWDRMKTYVSTALSAIRFHGDAFYSTDGANLDSITQDCNGLTANGLYYYTSNGPSTAIGATTNDGSVFVQGYNDNWVSQIAQDYRTGNLFIRSRNSGTWTPWRAVPKSSDLRSKMDVDGGNAGIDVSKGIAFGEDYGFTSAIAPGAFAEGGVKISYGQTITCPTMGDDPKIVEITFNTSSIGHYYKIGTSNNIPYCVYITPAEYLATPTDSTIKEVTENGIRATFIAKANGKMQIRLDCISGSMTRLLYEDRLTASINQATFPSSHAEGVGTMARSEGSHAEGSGTNASGIHSHAEGSGTCAYGNYSHAEGRGTYASGTNAHAEGAETCASDTYAHAEGYGTRAGGSYSHAEGSGACASGQHSHAEGYNTRAIDVSAHAEGSLTTADGLQAHAEGASTCAGGDYSHAEGQQTRANAKASHAEGASTTASGLYSHAEGNSTCAHGQASHAEGSGTCASGGYSHAEGAGTTASGSYSHAEGYCTRASGNYSHAGYNVSYAEGEGSFIHARKGIARNSDQVMFGFLTGQEYSPRYSSSTSNTDSSRQKNSIFSINHNTITHSTNQYGDPPHNNESEARYKITTNALLDIDNYGNMFLTGHMYKARGKLVGVLVANGRNITLDPGAIYVLYVAGWITSTSAFRGINAYVIAAGLGTSTTALAAPKTASIGTTGTVCCRLSSTYANLGSSSYLPVLGIGCCTTAITIRYTLQKVSGSTNDFN